MVEIEHQHADLGDVRLHYVTAGAGEPVVLLHGWPQTWYAWRLVLPWLAERHRVIAPDLRGLGDSSRPSAGYDKRTVADDVWRLVHGVLGHKRWHLVGHDWGGAVAYALAAAHPSAIRTLAIVDMVIPGFHHPTLTWAQTSWHLAFHEIAGLPEMLVEGREASYLSWYFRSLAHRPDAISEEAIREYVRAYTQPGAMRAGFEYYRAAPQDVADNTASASARRLDMPVLAVQPAGPFQGVVGVKREYAVAQSVRSVADDVREAPIDDAGHWVPEEQPERLAELLSAFFATA